MSLKLKTCIVPRCKNTNVNEPNKLFLRFTRHPIAVEEWKRVLKLGNDVSTAYKFCCEDHFNLAEDTTNWTFYCTIGQKLLLKPDVVPHLYIEDEPPESLKPQMSSEMREIKRSNIEAFSINFEGQSSSEQPVKRKFFVENVDVPITLCNSNVQHSPSWEFLVSHLQAKEMSIQNQSIIDCLEIEIEKPKNPFIQSITWSKYKKCNTIKFLIACSPNGSINYMSDVFGGQATNNDIVKESGYLDLLPANVSVIADRGFKQMEEVLLEKNCKLIRPTKDHIRENKHISALRIHVERMIQIIRKYEMSHMRTSLNTILKSQRVTLQSSPCGLINAQEPIIE